MTTSRRTILKKTIQLAIPLVSSSFFNMLGMFVCTLFIARLNSTVLAASALITATQTCLVVIGMCMLFSIGVMVGNAYGGKRDKEVGAIVQQGFLMAVFVSIPLMTIFLFIKPILLSLGQQPELVAINAQYFFWYMFDIPAFLGLIVLQQFILSVEKQRFVFVMSFVGFVLSVFLGYGLVYGHFGMPKLGVPGLGMAYVIQGWIMLVIYVVYTCKQKAFKPYAIFQLRVRSNFHLLKKAFVIGWPIALQGASDLFSFFVVTIMIGWIGETALAAQQIAIQYFFLLVIPIFAVAQTSGILVSQANGAQAFADVKRYGNMTLMLGLFFSAVVMSVFIFFPTELISLYLHQKSNVHTPIIDLAHIILILTGLRLVFDAIMEIKIGSLRGLYDTKFPMVLSMVLTWPVGISLVYLFGFTFHWGLVGMKCAPVLTTLISAVILWRRWHQKAAEIGQRADAR